MTCAAFFAGLPFFPALSFFPDLFATLFSDDLPAAFADSFAAFFVFFAILPSLVFSALLVYGNIQPRPA
jgi:hypothetical protein